MIAQNVRSIGKRAVNAARHPGAVAGIGFAIAMRMMPRGKLVVVAETETGLLAGDRASSSPGSPGVLLLIDTAESLSGDFPFSIERLGIGNLSVQTPGCERPADEPPADVALIRLGHPGVDALEEAARLLRRDPTTEIVFFTGEDPIDLRIARALGLHRIVPADQLVEWLRGAGPQLVYLTQTRRFLLE
jgi:hypothetical protein